jgi:formate dehydrogenase accessory protein FdhE
MSSTANGPDYEGRVGRAQYLAAQHPFAAEVLDFYQRLAGEQKMIYAEARKGLGGRKARHSSDPLRADLDYPFLVERFPRFLSFLESASPGPIAEAARQISSEGASAWTDSLTHFWRVGGRRRKLAQETERESAEMVKEFILRAFLQPHVEFLAEGYPAPSTGERPRHCPRCESVPLVGVLRPEGDGASRRLICSLCLGEWEFRRILCPACGEDSEKNLPVYVAEQFPHIRIEACDACKSYLRTIDLTKNGRAIPIVDDLAAIPLSLWAEEHGYSRFQPNLLGT